MHTVIIALLLFLACPSWVSAGLWFQDQEAAIVAINRASTPDPYTTVETFDTNPGYDLSWTETLGDPNPDYTTGPLSGTQSLYMDGSAATQTAYRTITASGDYEGRVLVKIISLPGGYRNIIYLNNSTVTQFTVSIGADGTVRASNGSGVATTVAAMSINTSYYMWYRYKAETSEGAADGIAEIAFSTTNSKPTLGNNYAISNAGTNVSTVNRQYVTATFSTTGPILMMDDISEK